MTDFLHPQSNSTPPSVGENLASVQPSIDAAPQQVPSSEALKSNESGQQKPEMMNSANQERTLDTGPIKRNFSEINRNFAKERSEDGEDGHPKRVVRKESPLFIHYYQSVFLLLITLFVAAGYVLLNPLITSFKETNQQIQTSLQEKDDADAFLRSIDRSIAAAKSISPDTLDRINEALPKDTQIPILLKTFSQLADQNKVTMGGIQFSPKTASAEDLNYGGYALVPVQISLSVDAPSYAVMRKYLEDLQTNIRLMDVDSISVAGDDASGKFTYALSLTTYYLQKTARTSSSGGAVTGNTPIPPSAPNVGSNDI